MAARLGFSQDDDQLVKNANALLMDMFNDIVQVLQEDSSVFRFEDFSLDRIDIFAEPGPLDTKRIYMDQRYALWLLDLNLITGIWAIADLSNDDIQDLGDLFECQLQLWNDLSNRANISDRMWPYYSRFPEIAALSASLMTAGIVFSLCHEIAHHSHSHFVQEQSREQEIEADHTGYKHFLRVYSEPEKLNVARIDYQSLASPCLSLAYIEMLERWMAKQAGAKEVLNTEFYPKASQRKYHLASAFDQEWTPESHHIYAGFSASLDELAKGLGIQDIH